MVQATLCEMGTQFPSAKKGQSHQFSAYLYCGQTAGCIKMPLGMEVGLRPGDFVRWGPSPYPKSSGAPHFSAHVYCGQTAGWMKTLLGTEADLVPGHTALDLDGVPAPANVA